MGTFFIPHSIFKAVYIKPLRRIEIITRESTEFVDITGKVEEIVRNEGVTSIVVFTKHTTTGLIINENEAGLRADIIS